MLSTPVSEMYRYEYDVRIHVTALISPNACVGEGTIIHPFSQICEQAVIGSFCTLGQGTYVAPGVHIGNRVKLEHNVAVFEGVMIEDDVFIGPNVTFTNVLRPRAWRRQPHSLTRICKGATLGANATILCGITIGEYAMVGAGSVVTKDVDPQRLVFGNPATGYDWACKCGAHVENFTTRQCEECLQAARTTPSVKAEPQYCLYYGVAKPQCEDNG